MLSRCTTLAPFALTAFLLSLASIVLACQTPEKQPQTLQTDSQAPAPKTGEEDCGANEGEGVCMPKID